MWRHRRYIHVEGRWGDKKKQPDFPACASAAGHTARRKSTQTRQILHQVCSLPTSLITTDMVCGCGDGFSRYSKADRCSAGLCCVVLCCCVPSPVPHNQPCCSTERRIVRDKSYYYFFLFCKLFIRSFKKPN